MLLLCLKLKAADSTDHRLKPVRPGLTMSYTIYVLCHCDGQTERHTAGKGEASIAASHCCLSVPCFLTFSERVKALSASRKPKVVTS